MDIRKQLMNVAEGMENGHITNENGNYYHHHEKSMENPQTFKNKTTCSPSSNKCTDEQNQSTKSYIHTLIHHSPPPRSDGRDGFSLVIH